MVEQSGFQFPAQIAMDINAMKEFTQLAWNADLEDDCRQLIGLAVREDLDQAYDWTTVALVPESGRAKANIVARQAGVVAGLEIVRLLIDQLEIDVHWTPDYTDGDVVDPVSRLGTLVGSARDLLTSERLLLNFIGRLSGIATLTHRYVAEVQDTRARIYDTRKTTPAYRRLEKYSVRRGGGWNHRTGLFDAILIKDNHLAFGRSDPGNRYSPAEAVEAARRFVQQTLPPAVAKTMIIEIEVDGLDQFAQVLPVNPDIILLDNMPVDQLRRAAQLRDSCKSSTQLESSGGVSLASVAEIAAAGVDRISVGALTHSAGCLDVSLDWVDLES